MLFSDELGPWGISVWDLSDYSDITYVAQYGPLQEVPTAHNQFIKGNYSYISHYADGLRILDITDPANPVEAGYFDTYPDSTIEFNGAWGVYPFAPSGNIYVSDTKYGLFIFRFDGSDSLVEISGTITDKVTGLPVPGAWIQTNDIYKGVADSLGRYLFHAPEGTHKLFTRMRFYLPDTSEVVLSIGTAEIFNTEIEHVPPSIFIETNALNFGAVEVFNSSFDSLSITNLSIAPLHFRVDTPAVQEFSIFSFPDFIHVDSSAVLTVSFSPEDISLYSDEVILISVAGEDTVTLDGMSLDYEIDPTSYRIPGTDSVRITALTASNSLVLFGIIEDADGIVIDSIRLFDDGTHGDINAGDSIYANSYPVPESAEMDYYVDLLLFSPDSVQIPFHGLERRVFYTVGPVQFASLEYIGIDSIRNPGDISPWILNIMNSGSSTPIQNIFTKITTNDTCVVEIVNRLDLLPELTPGEVGSAGKFFLIINENCDGGHNIEFGLSFASIGKWFWKDSFNLQLIPVGISEIEPIPKSYSLSQNFPNPFNPITVIRFSLPTEGFVTLSIFDISGRLIDMLVNEVLPAGYYELEWNASNVSSGIYFYRLKSADFTETKKMVLLK